MLTNNRFSFTGRGSDYFGVLIVNYILCIITLGFYIPWAYVRANKFNIDNTTFSGKAFSYTGNGADLIKGYLIILGVWILLGVSNTISPALFGLMYLAILLVGLPYLLNELIRYDSGRTHWNEKTFSYTSQADNFVKIFATNIALTIVTLGIYGAWARVAITRYVLQHMKLSNLRFDFEGKGNDLFWIMLKGVVLSFLTFGIYFFWYAKDLNHFMTNNIKIYQDDRQCSFVSELTVKNVVDMVLVGFLITLFTLGIGYAWVQVRNLRIYLSTVTITDNFAPETLN
jgi:uncharacterized membrane protein YjgN (DUF898 family)